MFMTGIIFLSAWEESFRKQIRYVMPGRCFQTTLHLLFRTGSVPISTVMRRLLTGYALWYNRRHQRHGHLFQNRFKSILCQQDSYLLELVRYIHLNPIRVGLIKDFDELSTYPYSGHSVLMGNVKHEWQNVQEVLGMFGGSHSPARRSYSNFVQEGIAEGKRHDLTGGGC